VLCSLGKFCQRCDVDLTGISFAIWAMLGQRCGVNLTGIFGFTIWARLGQRCGVNLTGMFGLTIQAMFNEPVNLLKRIDN